MIPVLERTTFRVPDLWEQKPRPYVLTLIYENATRQMFYVDDFKVRDGTVLAYHDSVNSDPILAFPAGIMWSCIRTSAVVLETVEVAYRQREQDQKDMEKLHDELHPDGSGGGPEGLQLIMVPRVSPTDSQVELKPDGPPAPGGYL